MTIAIDFDGTCVTHEYPIIGKEIGAIPILKELVENNHQLVLFTMRSGKELLEAVNWFKENEIPLYGIQTNPTQNTWTTSPKAYAHLYIDDAALGCPLIYNPSIADRFFVDWEEVKEILIKKGILLKTKNNGKEKD